MWDKRSFAVKHLCVLKNRITYPISLESPLYFLKLSGNRRRKDCLFRTNLLKSIYLTYLIASIYENYAVYRRTNYKWNVIRICKLYEISKSEKCISRSLKRTKAFKMSFVLQMYTQCVKNFACATNVKTSYSVLRSLDNLPNIVAFLV